MSNPSANCTILIPTFNRSSCLCLLIRFLDQQEVVFPVVVADSSDEGDFQRNSAFLADYLQATHLRFGRETFFYEKLLQAATQVSTEFVALCADDDIIVPASIQQFVDLLTSRPDCSFAHGYTTRFAKHEDGSIALDLEYQAIAYEEDSVLERIQSLHSRVESTVWSVYRRDALRTALEFARDSGTYFFGEMSTMTFMLAQGKAAALPIPLIYRSCEPFAEPISQWHPVFWTLKDGRDFQEKYAAYRDRLSEFISEKMANEPPLDRRNMEFFLDICFLEFFTPQWPLAKGLVLERLRELRSPGILETPTFKIYRVDRPWKRFSFRNWLSSLFERFIKSTDSSDRKRLLKVGTSRFKIAAKLESAMNKNQIRAIAADIQQFFGGARP